MNQIFRRSLALITALVLCLGLASGLAVQTEAASWKYNSSTREE